VFWQKRLQAAENKERELEKERQERERGCKLLKTRSKCGKKPNTEGTEFGAPFEVQGKRRPQRVTPRAIQMVIKRKELHGKQFVRI
jgi:hypothetical protein